MVKSLFAWIQKYERHLSALAMVAGFITDNIFFGRVDVWQTEVVFALYATICFVSIPVTQWIYTRANTGTFLRLAGFILPLMTQFALGGFWSGFVIFYGRSADWGVSWPFLLFVSLILLGSEYFNKYHSRLVFTSILFFFALYSYAIFAVPVYTHSIGTVTFIESGLVAIGVFAVFTNLLRMLARERFYTDVWRIRAGAFLVLVIINVFYFTNILPPLPLSAEATGVYHSVWRATGAYKALGEAPQSWQEEYLGFQPTLHVRSGEPVYVYSSVFAPTELKTTITHHWQWYDPVNKIWVTKAMITYPILGGRDGGYRGYSTVFMSQEGQWRVDVETTDSRRVTRLPFKVLFVNQEPVLREVLLK